MDMLGLEAMDRLRPAKPNKVAMVQLYFRWDRDDVLLKALNVDVVGRRRRDRPKMT